MSGLDAWPGEREEADDRLIETGAVPNYRGRLPGRMPVVMAPPPFRCFVCTKGITTEGLCPRCDSYDREADWAAHWHRFLPHEEKD